MYRITAALAALFVAAFSSSGATELKYAISPDFFEKNPGGKPLGPCHGGALIDKAGNIYISTDTDRGILVFSSEGKFLRAVGPARIHGMQMHEEHGTEYIYGARPSDHEVVKLKLNGERIWTIEYPKESSIYTNATDFKPCAVTVGPDDSIFIADGYGKNYVLKYDKNLKFVKAFGGEGADLGKFKTCHGITLETRLDKPLLMICNRVNNRLEYWDLNGNFVRVIRNDLRWPSAVNIRGDYVVVAELHGRVTVLDKDGNIAAQVGDNPNTKQRGNYGVPVADWTVGICNSPHGACMDKDGNLIISEWTPFGHLHKFDKQN